MTALRTRAAPAARLLLCILLLAGATACGERTDRLDQLRSAFDFRYQTLGEQLDNGSLANAVLLRTYAERLATAKPELSEVAALLGKEATRDGLAYGVLKADAASARTAADRDAAARQLLRAATMADPPVFNDSLADPVNTLAALSEGVLQPIPAPGAPRDAAPAADARDYLVGNETYGRWQRSPSTGGLEWFFIGALAHNAFAGTTRPSYDHWYRQRPWTVRTDTINRNVPTATHRQRFTAAAQRNASAPAYRGAPAGTATRNVSAWQSKPSSSLNSTPATSGGSFRDTGGSTTGRNTSSWSGGGK